MSVIDGAVVAFARRYDADASGDTAPTEQIDPSGYWRASQTVIHSSGVAADASSEVGGKAAARDEASISGRRVTAGVSSAAAARSPASACARANASGSSAAV